MVLLSMLLHLELLVHLSLLMNRQNQGQKDQDHKLLSELGQPSLLLMLMK